MRCTIGRRHGRVGWELIFGPDVHRDEQREFLNTLRFDRVNRSWAEVVVYTQVQVRKQMMDTAEDVETSSSSTLSSSSSTEASETSSSSSTEASETSSSSTLDSETSSSSSSSSPSSSSSVSQ